LAEVVDPLGAKVRFAYDEAGREVMRELADGSKLLRRYAASGELLESRWELPGGKVLVSQYSYDAQGRVVSIQEPGRWVRRSYDSQGRVIAELVSDSELGEDGRERPVERLWRWEYDPLGRQVKQIRPDGGVITRTFDTRGNLLVYEDPQGHRTSSSYDCFGKLRRSILREDSEGSLWVFGYDGLGRLASKQGVAAVRQEDPLLGAVRRLEHWSISQTDELLLRQRQLDSRQEVLFASTNALHQVTKLAITTLQGCVFLEAGRTFLSAPGSAAGVPSA
jgi:YD repeat-containing protein